MGTHTETYVTFTCIRNKICSENEWFQSFCGSERLNYGKAIFRTSGLRPFQITSILGCVWMSEGTCLIQLSIISACVLRGYLDVQWQKSHFAFLWVYTSVISPIDSCACGRIEEIIYLCLHCWLQDRDGEKAI